MHPVVEDEVSSSMTNFLLDKCVSHQVWEISSIWRLAIYNLVASSILGEVLKYVERLQIQESTVLPFIWSTNLGNWKQVSNCMLVGGLHCWRWTNSWRANTKSATRLDVSALDSSLEAPRRGNIVGNPKETLRRVWPKPWEGWKAHSD
jgi:hypothetical protein